MATKTRLDAELVRRGLATSRDHARELLADGRVSIAGIVVTKPDRGVDRATDVAVNELDGERRWVSRGGTKLAGALDVFTDLDVNGCRCLDAGASTGGFTDVLLARGAAHVIAVDVGYGQLAWPLRSDDRVTVIERFNVRELTTDILGGPVDLCVADLSFISLTLVLPALTGCVTVDGDLVLLVKPQFEVGRDDVGAGGVVRDPQLRAAAVRRVAEAAAALGLGSRGVTASPLPGPAGNVEYFLWLHRGPSRINENSIDQAVSAGPQ